MSYNFNGSENLENRWELQCDGSISWDVGNGIRLPHEDHVEMSGRFVSLIVRYGVDNSGGLVLSRTVVFPMLRTIPNNTHASLIREYGLETTPGIKVNNVRMSQEKPYRVTFNGTLEIDSHTEQGIDLIRTIFPSTKYCAAMESVKLKNVSEKAVTVEIGPLDNTGTARGVYGIYITRVSHTAPEKAVLGPGEELSFGIAFSGRKVMEEAAEPDAEEELAKRLAFVRRTRKTLRFESPDETLNKAFDFAKLRAAESIFETKGGLMHCPGGKTYYAAVWANDQAEYAGPFFPFMGDAAGNEASLNCYRLYQPFMGPDFKAIPSSIVAEGIDIWEGAGDRGDAAMYAYGASRFALEMGDRRIAEEIWPGIKWCLEYCRRQMTSEGVIASDSDELENRFPSGNANLSTASLAYGGLRTAAHLARALGRAGEADEYNRRADALAKAIENHFGHRVDGYETYRYYDGNEILRSWICLPLTMGIMDRREGTVEALFSEKLWTRDGLATEAGDKTFWDRSTLYGFRGVFNAGETEKALHYFKDYTRRRLLGEHVPYPVEAYPEGDQRQLSAESALYCRIVTEGIFGINPMGFDSFTCTPRLPEEWDRMALRSVKAFGRDFDITVERSGAELAVNVSAGGKVLQYRCIAGEGIEVKLG